MHFSKKSFVFKINQMLKAQSIFLILFLNSGIYPSCENNSLSLIPKEVFDIMCDYVGYSEGLSKQIFYEEIFSKRIAITSMTIRDEDTIILGSQNGSIKIYNLSNSRIRTIKESDSNETDIKFLLYLTDNAFFSYAQSHCLNHWTENLTKCHKEFNANIEVLTILPRTSKRNPLIVLKQGNNPIRIWDPITDQTNVLLGRYPEIKMLTNNVSEKIVSLSVDNSLRIWNSTNGTCLKTINLTDLCESILGLPDNELATVMTDRTINILNLETGDIKCSLIGHKTPVTHLILLKDTRLVSVEKNGIIRFWNRSTGECEETLYSKKTITAMISLTDDTIFCGLETGEIAILKNLTLSKEKKDWWENFMT